MSATIVTWDWKEQPEWSFVNEALDKSNGAARIWRIETYSDSYGIVIGVFNSRSEAQRWFEEHCHEEP